MEDEIKYIFKIVGLEVNNFNELSGLSISREILLSDNKYNEIKHLIPQLKENFSSSFMTSLHKNADKSQKWPLLNLIRQILNVYGYKMYPIRKADGYTLEGIKKYKRYFQIQSKNNINTNETKIIYLQNDNLVSDNNTDFLDDENID
jgi:hypothetical protein